VFYLLKQTPSALELVLTDHIAQHAAEVRHRVLYFVSETDEIGV
jgi:hypothetical protein